MASKRGSFDLSGPSDLTQVDWNNADHRRSVAACLVESVYVLERDRQEEREGSQALAPRWWEFFNFQLQRKVVDKADSSIFGAIFKYKLNHSADGPHFVVAFRGTLLNIGSVLQDIMLDFKLIQQGLHSTSRFKTAMQEVRNTVATAGDSRVWLAGHSLGSAIALQAGKNMAKDGSYLESFLFNPPYLSAPIEKIKNKKWKRGIQILNSTASALGALAKKSLQQLNQSADSFAALSPWVPQLFVNAEDYICSGYIGYFEHRDWMQKKGAGAIQRVASHHSSGSIFKSKKKGKQAEPLHLIPSANLTINLDPPLEFMKAHSIREWWKQDLRLESQVYEYN
ncbi:GDSL esterase/lipase At4g10955-like [Syzygium oleosum]|uniref:GDSL esterase/lipase At4g10955-like n=1 Tax=Syzygium oleosum TaxID=219896 RepID=UPI0024B9518D|nr:GDSL esterase/lipase At4g10955-like [Syzygium oleosum]